MLNHVKPQKSAKESASTSHKNSAAAMVLLHELVPSVAEHCRGLVVGKRVQVTNWMGNP